MRFTRSGSFLGGARTSVPPPPPTHDEQLVALLKSRRADAGTSF
jgi:hypothetical protein